MRLGLRILGCACYVVGEVTVESSRIEDQSWVTVGAESHIGSTEVIVGAGGGASVITIIPCDAVKFGAWYLSELVVTSSWKKYERYIESCPYAEMLKQCSFTGIRKLR